MIGVLMVCRISPVSGILTLKTKRHLTDRFLLFSATKFPFRIRPWLSEIADFRLSFVKAEFLSVTSLESSSESQRLMVPILFSSMSDGMSSFLSNDDFDEMSGAE